MNNSGTRKTEANDRFLRMKPDYLAPRNLGKFSIDPAPQASADKSRAIAAGSI